ncbi:bacterial transcriptional activator domain-containing protein [Nocardia sp. NPDC051832]|uniref:AfsR/SARP family transcriptional regulator n=1 Tax=Nocardia sp. NPDC051832 TaxID=3155673 RepID=UPI0034415EA9
MDAVESAAVQLHLFGGPYVTVGAQRREIPEGGGRLLALLALRPGPVDRRCAGGLLWPVVAEQRASGNLRSALWRLRAAGLDLVCSDQRALSLRAEVVVDAHLVGAWACRLMQGTARAADLPLDPAVDQALELLPGWHDDWVIIERERLRHRVLHAVESVSRQFCRAGRYAEGVDAAMLAVGADPMRESAQRVLIEAHLAEGNVGEARRAFGVFRRMILRELGVPPSAELSALLAVPGHLGPGRVNTQRSARHTRPSPVLRR